MDNKKCKMCTETKLCEEFSKVQLICKNSYSLLQIQKRKTFNGFFTNLYKHANSSAKERYNKGNLIDTFTPVFKNNGTVSFPLDK
jgi:hypothetical protein